MSPTTNEELGSLLEVIGYHMRRDKVSFGAALDGNCFDEMVMQLASRLPERDGVRAAFILRFDPDEVLALLAGEQDG